LLIRNLRDVFGENDPLAGAGIDEIYTEDWFSTTPEGVYRGRDEMTASRADQSYSP